MKVDRKGNVYCGGPGGIWIISPEGKHLGTIPLRAISLAFGDVDARSVYFTGITQLYRLRVNVAGRLPGMSGSN
jgi:gluconolactonase